MISTNVIKKTRPESIQKELITSYVILRVLIFDNELHWTLSRFILCTQWKQQQQQQRQPQYIQSTMEKHEKRWSWTEYVTHTYRRTYPKNVLLSS